MSQKAAPNKGQSPLPMCPLIGGYTVVDNQTYFVIDIVILLEVSRFPWQQMDVYVFHGLTCISTILHCEGERRRLIHLETIFVHDCSNEG